MATLRKLSHTLVVEIALILVIAAATYLPNLPGEQFLVTIGTTPWIA